MRRLLLTLALTLLCAGGLLAQGLDSLDIFSITTCPGEDASTQMRLSWGSDTLLEKGPYLAGGRPLLRRLRHHLV